MPAIKLQEIVLGRPMTDIERACVEEEIRVVKQRDIWHAMWRAEQSERARRVMGLGGL